MASPYFRMSGLPSWRPVARRSVVDRSVPDALARRAYRRRSGGARQIRAGGAEAAVAGNDLESAAFDVVEVAAFGHARPDRLHRAPGAGAVIGLGWLLAEQGGGRECGADEREFSHGLPPGRVQAEASPA